MIQGFEKRLFSWDNKDGIKVSEEDRKRIIEFIKQHIDPRLSLTAIVEKADSATIKITDGSKTVFLKLDAYNRIVSFQTGNKKEEFNVRDEKADNDNIDYYVYPKDILQGPWHEFAGTVGIILTSIYFMLLAATII